MSLQTKVIICSLYLCNFALHVFTLDTTWWKHMQIYELLPTSFKDSDGDGIGDFNGLTSKLDHFVDLDIEAIYITPHYPSPMIDNGYDISNFTDVNPMLGKMQDFDNLMTAAKSRGIKVILDMVINHSSDKHPWFIKSTRKEDPYTDYYIWKDALGYDYEGNPIPPNNWVSIFEGSAWEWNNHRKQFYLHQCAIQQPDFNFRNKKFINEIKRILKFWLDKGVAGFRMDAIGRLIEDAQFRDEPPASPDIKNPRMYMEFDHIYTVNLPETYEIIQNLRQFVHKITRKFVDYERVLLGEVFAEGEELQKYYWMNGRRVLHVPLASVLMMTKSYENATFYDNIISAQLQVTKNNVPTWNADNHDRRRKGLMHTEEYQFMFYPMVMFLPGIAYHYYGQEIGMTGYDIRPDQHLDTHEDTYTKTLRDAARLPMQWDDSLNAGFSNHHTTYLPVSPNYWRINVEKQKKEEFSVYNMFKKMSRMRKTETFKYGDLKTYMISTWVFAFTRSLQGRKTYVIINNFGSETEIVDLHNSIDNLPRVMQVEVASPNSAYKPGDKILSNPGVKNILVLRPAASVVLGGMHSSEE